MTRNGFTLLEILVALAVMGFLLVGLTQGWQFGLQSWDRQATQIADAADLEAYDRTVRSLLTQIEPGSSIGPAPLVGTAEQISFVSELPRAAATATHRANVTLLATGGRLLVRWSLHPHEVPQTTGGAGTGMPTTAIPISENDVEILRGVDHLEISYWRTNPGMGQRAGWASSWTDGSVPPLLRLHVVFAKGDKRHWPDIVVAPMIERRE